MICKICGKISVGHGHCLFCGAKNDGSGPVTPVVIKGLCPKCGKQADPGVKFCPECGAELPQEGYDPPVSREAARARYAPPPQPSKEELKAERKEKKAQKKEKSGRKKAMAGFVLSFFPLIGVICMIIAITLFGIKRADPSTHNYAGLIVALLEIGSYGFAIFFLAAIICSAKGIKYAKKHDGYKKGIARLGVIISLVCLVAFAPCFITLVYKISQPAPSMSATELVKKNSAKATEYANDIILPAVFKDKEDYDPDNIVSLAYEFIDYNGYTQLQYVNVACTYQVGEECEFVICQVKCSVNYPIRSWYSQMPDIYYDINDYKKGSDKSYGAEVLTTGEYTPFTFTYNAKDDYKYKDFAKKLYKKASGESADSVIIQDSGASSLSYSNYNVFYLLAQTDGEYSLYQVKVKKQESVQDYIDYLDDRNADIEVHVFGHQLRNFTPQITVKEYTKKVYEVGDPTVRTHTYATKWTHDDTYHWHAATCPHTEEVSEKAEHTFTGWECSVCGYEASINVENIGELKEIASENLNKFINAQVANIYKKITNQSSYQSSYVSNVVADVGEDSATKITRMVLEFDFRNVTNNKTGKYRAIIVYARSVELETIVKFKTDLLQRAIDNASRANETIQYNS